MVIRPRTATMVNVAGADVVVTRDGERAARVSQWPFFSRGPVADLGVELEYRVVDLATAKSSANDWLGLLMRRDSLCRGFLLDEELATEEEMQERVGLVRDGMRPVLRDCWLANRGGEQPRWAAAGSSILIGATRESMAPDQVPFRFFARLLPFLRAGWLPASWEGDEREAELANAPRGVLSIA